MLEINFSDSPDQDIEITAVGSRVNSILLGAVEPDFDDPEERLPDFVAVFAAGAEVGLFGDTKARIADLLVSPNGSHVAWKLEIRNAEPGALRILANLTDARRFDSAAVRGGGTGSPHNPNAPYPWPRDLPFPIVREPNERPIKNRLVQVTFLKPLDDELIRHCYAAFDRWNQIILLGGYAEGNQHPSTSGAVPDMAFLLDEFTIQQSFTEMFLCDEGAFGGILHWALRLHGQGQPVEKVILR